MIRARNFLVAAAISVAAAAATNYMLWGYPISPPNLPPRETCTRIESCAAFRVRQGVIQEETLAAARLALIRLDPRCEGRVTPDSVAKSRQWLPTVMAKAHAIAAKKRLEPTSDGYGSVIYGTTHAGQVFLVQLHTRDAQDDDIYLTGFVLVSESGVTSDEVWFRREVSGLEFLNFWTLAGLASTLMVLAAAVRSLRVSPYPHSPERNRDGRGR